MVVFPEPFGPRRPMTSPAPTSSDTPSTASLGPYHFVSLSATMMGLMMSDPAQERRDGRAAPALALRGSGGTLLLPELRGVLHRLPRVGIVRGEKAGVLPRLHLADEIVRAQDPLGAVGERHVRQEVLLHILLVVDVVAREDHRAGLRQPDDQHLASRRVPHPALHDD